MKDVATNQPMGGHLPLKAFEVMELPRRRPPIYLRALAALGAAMIFAVSVVVLCVMVGA